jgi:ADP-ribose pyrophosphatase
MKSAKVLKRRGIFTGRIVNLSVERVLLPNGSTTDVEIVRHSGAVAVVAVDDHDQVLLVRQYRHAIGEWLLEIPAGRLEPDEDPLECVVRELEEETGFRPGKIESLGRIWPTPGFSDEKIWLFLASKLEAGQQELEEDEVLTVVRMPWLEALAAARDGRICDGKSISALLRAEKRVQGDSSPRSE